MFFYLLVVKLFSIPILRGTPEKLNKLHREFLF